MCEILQKGNGDKSCLSQNVNSPHTLIDNGEDIVIQDSPNKILNTGHNSSSTTIPTTRNFEKNDSDKIEKKRNDKRKIIVLADQQGKGTQHQLQYLVGTDFEVTCFWKSGARLNEVLNSMNNEVLKLTKRDFVIIIGGTNDMSPFKVEENLILFFNFAKNTNIIVSEIPFNSALHEHKLNYNIKLLCNNYGHTSFVDMDYSRFIPRGNKFTISLCRYLLKDILCIDYKHKMKDFEVFKQNKKKLIAGNTTLVDKSSQTDFECIGNSTEIKISDYSNKKSLDDLFRT